MQGRREGRQVSGRAEGRVDLVDILGPVSVIRLAAVLCISAIRPPRARIKDLPPPGTVIAHPSLVLPLICSTMGEIHTAVKPMPWM